MTSFKMLLARFSAAIFGFAILCCNTERVWAQFIQPVGTYQEIFVASATVNGASSDISTYNS